MANFIEIFHGGIIESVNVDNIDRLFAPIHHNKDDLRYYGVKVLYREGNEINYVFLDDEIGKKEAQALYDKLRGKKEPVEINELETCKVCGAGPDKMIHDTSYKGDKLIRGFTCDECHAFEVIRMAWNG